MALTVAVDQIQPYSSTTLSWEGVPTGMPLAISVISYGTRTNLSAVAGVGIAFGDYFTKLRSDTVLRATSTIFGAGYYSGNCGVGVVLDYGTNTRWDYGCAYQYDGQWSSTAQTTLVMGHHQWTGVSAGRHLISFGWNPADSSTNRPFVYINPNSSDDSRNNQMVSRIVVYEVYP